jgi:DNA helicase-2/ATP-dependent DNA helicase PcrA
MYRLAWSKLRGVDISEVSAAFHYVPTSVTDRPSDLMNEAELIKLLDL